MPQPKCKKIGPVATAMALCARCGAETGLYIKGVPICPECDRVSHDRWDDARRKGEPVPDLPDEKPELRMLRKPVLNWLRWS
jgi:hypothetical protein